MHLLEQNMVKRAADQHWAAMGCEGAEQAKGIFAWAIRRKVAAAAMRGRSQLMLSRLQYVGAGVHAAARRRSAAFHSNSARWMAVSKRSFGHGSSSASPPGASRPSGHGCWKRLLRY